MEESRLQANGLEFTALSAGQGPTVLCLHGFPDCVRSFRFQLPALAAAGYRGISVGLRGYEPSAQPGLEPAHYHPMRAADDVIALAEQLGPVHLVGHDWGAIISYLVAAQRPDLLLTLTTVAVPHAAALQDRRALRLVPAQLRKSWYIFFFQLRGLSDRVVARNDFAFIERLWRDWSPGFVWEPAEMEALKAVFRAPGVQRSALGYYRAMLDRRLEDSKRADALNREPIEVPTLAVTGATDGCLDTRLYEFMPEPLFPAGLRVERMQGAGHFAHQEDPDAFNHLLVDWLGEGRGTAE